MFLNNKTILFSDQNGIWLSINRGNNWKNLVNDSNQNLPKAEFYEIFSVPNMENLIYAVCGNQGVFKSSNKETLDIFQRVSCSKDKGIGSL